MIDKIFNNRYKILKLIGKGGMASVYLANDMRLNRNVALKVLKEEYKHNSIFLRRFKNEALSVASLSSPNIVSIYDVGEENEINYIVMEYVDGVSLKDYILSDNEVNENEILKMAIEICSGITHAHKNKIIHRDIKPHNILINKDGVCKVTDFGIAKLETDSNITQTGNIMGSIAYFSPEQANGIKVDERSDIYSLGVTLYEAATQKLPFTGENFFSIAYKHVHENPEPPKSHTNSLSLEFSNLILKTMNKNPDDRFQSTEELLINLNEILIMNKKKSAKQKKSNTETIDSKSPNIDETAFFNPTDEMRKIYPQDNKENIINNQESPNDTSQKKIDVYTSSNQKLLNTKIIAGFLIAVVAVIIILNTMLSGNSNNTTSENTDSTDNNVILPKTTKTDETKLPVSKENNTPTKKPTKTTEPEKTVAETTSPPKTTEFTVKNYVGQKADTVRTQLLNDGWSDSYINFNNYADENSIIISQSQKTGTVVVINTEILSFECQQVEATDNPNQRIIPNVIGIIRNAAESELVNNNISYKIVHENTETQPKGYIFKTDPPPGTIVAKGQKVTVYLSIGPAVPIE